jgi:hypothetical protein
MKFKIFMIMFFVFFGLSFPIDYESYFRAYNWTVYQAEDINSYEWYSINGKWNFYKNFRFCDNGIIRDRNGKNIIGEWIAQNDFFTVKFWHLSDGFFGIQHKKILGVEQQKFLNSHVICGWGNYIHPTFTNIKILIVRGSKI